MTFTLILNPCTIEYQCKLRSYIASSVPLPIGLKSASIITVVLISSPLLITSALQPAIEDSFLFIITERMDGLVDLFVSRVWVKYGTVENKVITTMAIEPLDDHRYCARSVFTHLGLWRKLYDCSLHHSTTSQCIILQCVRLTFSTTSLSSVGWNLMGRLFDPRFEELGGGGGRGWAHLIAHPWVLISALLTHGLSLTVFELGY